MAGPGNWLGGEVPRDHSATGSARKKKLMAAVDEIHLFRAAACDWRLSRGDVGVYASILDHADDTWLSFPGTRTMSEQARLAPSNVVTSVEKLERLGYIRVTRRGQRKRQDYQILQSPDVYESAPARKSSGFGKSAPIHKSSESSASATDGRSSEENPSAPVDMKLSAPMDRNHLLLPIGTEGTLEGTIEGTKRARAKKTAEIVLPEWLPADAWKSWKDHRGKKFSEKAQKLAISKLEKLRSEGHDPARLIDLAIESSWVSFYPRDTTKADQRAANGAVTRDTRSEAELVAANEAALARLGGSL